MSTPSTLQQWISEQAVPLFLIAFALLTGFAILSLSAHSRRSSLLRHRSGRSEDTFVAELTGWGYDPEIARLTYRYLQEHQNIAFPVEPMDDLDRDLGLDSADLNETIRDLLDVTARTHLPGLLHSPLVTVEDLVRYLQASPRKKERAA